MISPEATFIVLRESLEGFLIISILTGLATKFGKPQARIPLIAGALGAVAVTVVLGVATDTATRTFLEESGSEALFAATAALVAVAILTYMVVWMYKHTIHLVAQMRGKARTAVEIGKPFALFALAFAAVGREGIETILFFATLAPTTAISTLALSTVVGFAVSVVLAFLLFRGMVRLNLQKFFTMSGILLVLFGGGLLAGALGGYAEAGVLPEVSPAWSTKAVLDEDGLVGGIFHAIVGYLDSPSWLQVVAYVAYVAGIGSWYLVGGRARLKAAAHAAPAETTIDG